MFTLCIQEPELLGGGFQVWSSQSELAGKSQEPLRKQVTLSMKTPAGNPVFSPQNMIQFHQISEQLQFKSLLF